MRFALAILVLLIPASTAIAQQTVSEEDPGPQSGSVGTRMFMPSRSDKQSLAELGFIVVELDAMGTPMRSKSFHTAYYGNMGDNGLPDQIGGIRQLADRHEWMDLKRVGIYGHSGGGFASTAGTTPAPKPMGTIAVCAG